MPISPEDVLKIAQLAKLKIRDDEGEQYATDLSNIMTLVDQMNSVDTKSIEPMAHPLEVTQRLRVDKVTETNQRDKFQSIAPNIDKGLYLVPKVIE
jgi:aspartyl-tRNA(Asn)/glutamyl-tRNA(Gln) amidotransferase subunit C